MTLLLFSIKNKETTPIPLKAIDTVRILATDGVQKEKSRILKKGVLSTLTNPTRIILPLHLISENNEQITYQ